MKNGKPLHSIQTLTVCAYIIYVMAGATGATILTPEADGERLWYGIPRGASFSPLANSGLWGIPEGQAKYWCDTPTPCHDLNSKRIC